MRRHTRDIRVARVCITIHAHITKPHMMQKHIIQKWHDYVPFEGTVFTEPSLTVPDQSMDLQTILSRYAHGIPLGAPPIYEQTEFVNLNKMDLADREDLINSRKEELRTLKRKIASDKAKTSAKEATRTQRSEVNNADDKLQSEVKRSASTPNNP